MAGESLELERAIDEQRRAKADKKNKGGRPRLPLDVKARQGTLRPWRERARLQKESAEAQAKPETRVIQIDPDPEAKQDYVAVARRYMAGVRDGSVIAGKWVKLAVERQYRDEARFAEGGDYAFSNFYAAKACAFIESLPHVEGRWTSSTIHLEPWQCFVVCALFGWRHRADALRRRFTFLYLELARKNAKSTLAAGIALYHLLMEEEPGAQVVCGATTGSQARIVFNIAKKMVERSAELRARGCFARANSIVYLDGVMKPINAKASTQDGLNPSVILLDEAHAQNFELHDVLKSAQGARDNSLMLLPTTAGYDLLSVGYAMNQAVRKILEQVVVSEHSLGVIYTIDDGDDWTKEENWFKANPMLGVTPKMDKFRQNFADALTTPSLERDFMIKQLSVWSGAGSGFFQLLKWDACADPSCKLEKFVGQACTIGGDLSQTDDITAVSYTFKIGEVYWCCVQLYLPEELVQERARKVPEYDIFVKLGVLKLTPGAAVDINVVEADIRANIARYNLKPKDICFDQWGSFQMIASLFNDGLPARTELKNAHNATPSARLLEAAVKHRKLRHDGNPALRWQASNVVVTRKVDGSLVPKKETEDSPNKIDGIEAILRSLSGWIRIEPKKGGGGQFQAMVFG